MRYGETTRTHERKGRLLAALLALVLFLSMSNVADATSRKATKRYTGWKTVRTYDRLYYSKYGREYSKKVASTDRYYYKNGKKVTRQWVQGRYLNKQGVACGDQQGTIKSFLTTAIQPAGRTAYVWGGGWPSTTSRLDVTKGQGKKWRGFYRRIGKNYNYKKYRYQYAKGLDCSGFVGWTIYNTVNKKSGNESFTTYATNTGKFLSGKGLGKITPAKKVKKCQPGDIMYNSSHVWIVLGTCADGSVLLVHSSPGGVQINGTPTSRGKRNSKAVQRARAYMKKYRPEWKFQIPTKNYLGKYHQFRWNYGKTQLMADPEGWRKKSGEEVLRLLFK